MENINGFFAKRKVIGKTLYSFRWGLDDELYIIEDSGKEYQVDKEQFDIINIAEVQKTTAELARDWWLNLTVKERDILHWKYTTTPQPELREIVWMYVNSVGS